MICKLGYDILNSQNFKMDLGPMSGFLSCVPLFFGGGWGMGCHGTKDLSGNITINKK